MTNEIITLVKDTSLAFVLAVTEMFTMAKANRSGTDLYGSIYRGRYLLLCVQPAGCDDHGED